MRITYQGIACTSVHWRNSRGLEPDPAVIEFWTPDFRALKFERGRAPGNAVQEQALEQPQIIYEIGDLLIDSGEGYSREIKDLYVSKVNKDAVKLPDGRGIVTLTLLDVRRLWDFGWLERWRFNTEDERGRDSLADICANIVKSLPGSGDLVRVPDSWSSEFPAYQFQELGRPRAALRKILNDRDAVLTLRDDTSVAIYLKNEEDPANPIPDDSLVEDSGGRGHSGGVGFESEPLGCIVVGGPREASVTIDRWEPVLMIEGLPVPLAEGLVYLSDVAAEETTDDREATIDELQSLSEETSADAQEQLRALEAEYEELKAEAAKLYRLGRTSLLRPILTEMTRLADEISEFRADNGERAKREIARLERMAALAEKPLEIQRRAIPLIERLLRFLVRPDTWQVLNGFDEEGTSIIRRDAYRLFRLPGAEDANYELLPILKRAERDRKGLRLQPQVRAYTWKRVPHYLANRPSPLEAEAARLAALLVKQRNALINALVDEDTRQSSESPSDLFEYRAFANKLASVLGVGEWVNANSGKAIVARFRDTDASQQAEAYAQNMERLHRVNRQIDPSYTGDLEDDISGIVYEAAYKFAAPGLDFSFDDVKSFFALVYQSFNPNATSEDFNVDRAIQRLQAEYRQQVQDIVAKIIARKREAERNREIGTLRFPELFYFENTNAPIVDRGARVVDAELGLIRTSFVAMQLIEEGLDSASLASAGELQGGPSVDRSWPVSVTFGTRVVPRFFPPQVPTGFQSAGTGDRVPPQVVEAQRSGNPVLGTYTSAWVRAGNSIRRVPIETMNPRHTRTISKPELRELIQITGISNRDELDRQSEEIARDVLLKNSIYQYSRTNYLHPQGVFCDGIVSGVNIQSRQGVIGFRTLVVRGATDAPFESANKTTTRRARIDQMRDAESIPGGLDFRDQAR